MASSKCNKMLGETFGVWEVFPRIFLCIPLLILFLLYKLASSSFCFCDEFGFKIINLVNFLLISIIMIQMPFLLLMQINRLESEFSSYKVRAHALLQKKDAEILAAKDTELIKAQEEAVKVYRSKFPYFNNIQRDMNSIC